MSIIYGLCILSVCASVCAITLCAYQRKSGREQNYTERTATLLQNVERYDGTPRGQVRIGGEGK